MVFAAALAFATDEVCFAEARPLAAAFDFDEAAARLAGLALRVGLAIGPRERAAGAALVRGAPLALVWPVARLLAPAPFVAPRAAACLVAACFEVALRAVVRPDRVAAAAFLLAAAPRFVGAVPFFAAPADFVRLLAVRADDAAWVALA